MIVAPIHESSAVPKPPPRASCDRTRGASALIALAARIAGRPARTALLLTAGCDAGRRESAGQEREQGSTAGIRVIHPRSATSG